MLHASECADDAGHGAPVSWPLGRSERDVEPPLHATLSPSNRQVRRRPNGVSYRPGRQRRYGRRPRHRFASFTAARPSTPASRDRSKLPSPRSQRPARREPPFAAVAAHRQRVGAAPKSKPIPGCRPRWRLLRIRGSLPAKRCDRPDKDGPAGQPIVELTPRRGVLATAQ